MKRTIPPLRADRVGSLLRPKVLHDARAQFAKGEISAGDLKAVEDQEIERVIKKQEEIGLQAVTDGEFRRSWWHLDFLWGLDGIEKTSMNTGIAFATVTTRNEGTKVTGKLGMAGPHPMVEHFKFVQSHTKRTPKITIPAPSAIYGRPVLTPIDRLAYPSMEAFWDDLGEAYKKAVRGFADAGCQYLQFDEVFIAMLCDPKYRQQMKDRGDDPDKLGPLYGSLINAAMSGTPSDMRITMHLCRGNYKSTFMGAGGYAPRRKFYSTRSTCTAILWNMIPTAPAASNRYVLCRRASRSCSGSSPRRTASWRARIRLSAGSMRHRSTFRLISSASPVNAASHRPRKAIR
jgi:5-methyltetrahydropteroyltriglutamate--homocysteine methyltransferase